MIAYLPTWSVHSFADALGALAHTHQLVVKRWMGFDCTQVPYLQRLLREHRRDVRTIGLTAAADSFWDNRQRHLDSVPPDAWPKLRG